MSQQFEWDAAKAVRNMKKHGVSFEEAVGVFAEPLARIYDAPDHSTSERRAIIVGTSAQGALLVVHGPVGQGTNDHGENRHCSRA